jgi:DNA polymerase I-like protein with 3'-5' exonuclease and polymerase domains
VGDRAALTLRRAQAALSLSLSLGLTGAHALESQTSHTLARMEQRGLHVNASALAATASASERLADECDRQIIRMQREPQTAERDTEIRAALQAHAKHVRAVKTANAIAGSLIRGRVHSNFDAGGAATGRITSSGPNLQNLGPALRSCVDAAGGNVIVVGDWQQFEPRIVAAYTGEPLLTEAFALGVDVYEAIASDMGCTRSEAKAIFLSSMFEGGPALVSKRLGCSPRKARAFIERHRSQMRLVESFRHRMVTRALGELPTHAVVLPSGRRRTIHGLESGEKRELAKARRQVFNTIIQGTAAEALKETITRLDAQLEEAGAGHLVLTVYDEIVVETPARHEGLVRRLLRDSMQHAHSIPANTPAKVGAGLTLEAARANSS